VAEGDPELHDPEQEHAGMGNTITNSTIA